MGNPQGGKMPMSYPPPYYMGGWSMVDNPPKRSTQAARCRYCGSRYSEKSLRDAKCENCGATL